MILGNIKSLDMSLRLFNKHNDSDLQLIYLMQNATDGLIIPLGIKSL